jgi:hypothetical protein
VIKKAQQQSLESAKKAIIGNGEQSHITAWIIGIQQRVMLSGPVQFP